MGAVYLLLVVTRVWVRVPSAPASSAPATPLRGCHSKRRRRGVKAVFQGSCGVLVSSFLLVAKGMLSFQDISFGVNAS